MDLCIEVLDDIFKELSLLEGTEEGNMNIKILQSDVKEAQELLNEMKINIITICNKTEKEEYLKKMKQYQLEIEKYRKHLLTENGKICSSSTCSITQHKEEVSLDILRKAQSELTKTEAIGVEILKNLQGQTDVMKHTQKNLEEINGQLNFVSKTLYKLGKWWRS
ncbi:MAG: hypothetical protein Sylvanvirus26_3 [Sylvanvirus sp.]|uniref:Vesicle transport v-SNARE N-terminal domain-containing protein n=1 Tax=Sylvanvirus sp. TaxID=2487774 RepID=A0A3G5ALB7_9VIRU|nr:MAG: hypothetical protein Sylvanvirus26_3 [Sylvanvirus sp.]